MVLAKILNTVIYNSVTYNKNDEIELSLKIIDDLGAQNFEILKFIVSPPKDKMMRFPNRCKEFRN